VASGGDDAEIAVIRLDEDAAAADMDL